MKKISTVNWVKIILTVVVLGMITIVVCKWNVSLEPPQKIESAKTQILVDVVMPAYIIAEQTDVDLQQRNPEAYANRFNSNNELYNRSITLVCENGVQSGDTVQLKYSFNYCMTPHWDLISVKPPFYERFKQTDSNYIEYIKGVVSAVNN
ncbi:MAG: hypothetical protein PF488_00290 [Patescibacteria group bacterium]|jgi:hypothetical protein|nr:hypothetical protein [Patescibacteria group bacterium]